MCETLKVFVCVLGGVVHRMAGVCLHPSAHNWTLIPDTPTSRRCVVWVVVLVVGCSQQLIFSHAFCSMQSVVMVTHLLLVTDGPLHPPTPHTHTLCWLKLV